MGHALSDNEIPKIEEIDEDNIPDSNMEEKLKNSIKSQQKKSKKKKGMNRGNHEIEPVTSGGCCSCLFGAPKTKN